MKHSINGKVWRKKPLNEHWVSELRSQLDISDIVAKILSSRVDNLEDACNFLSPKIKNLLPDPFHLMDMEKAVIRVIEAMTLKQKICIFGDYDVDGATSASLLKNLFRDLNIDVDIYVPNRILEGYGPNILAMDRIRNRGTALLISVDCGTSSHEAIDHAHKIGLDIIVIDHHISADIPCAAIAVINPNRMDETSKYRYLAAVGVAFLFSIALISRLKKELFFENSNNVDIPNLMKYLDLVALGTICDVMPITHLNRGFVAQGLKIMQLRQNVGIKALCDIANIDNKLDSYHLGFVLGPRINAGGRVGKSDLGTSLLSTECTLQANKLAMELDIHNNERKVIEFIILEEALAKAEEQRSNNLLFIVGQGWHPGIIGIIAGRLKEKFNKPVAIIAINDNIGKASCRSIKGLDFGKKIIKAKQHGLIIDGGGHHMAAGFTVHIDKLLDLQIFLNILVDDHYKNFTRSPVIDYEDELTTSSINLALMIELSKLEPYGHGNFEPIFRYSNLFVLKAKIVGMKHISCLLSPDRDGYGHKSISAIAFNAVGTEFETILLNKQSHVIDVLASLKTNHFQNRETIQLQIKDIAKS